MPRTVTLYVPVYNAAQYLDRVIPSIMAQTYPLHEVLIIDDGSADDSVAVAERHVADARYPLRIVRHPRNKGLGAARNTGVMESRSEFVASIDADVRLEPDWLERVMEVFEADTANEISGVGGCMEEDNDRTWADGWRATHMRQCWGPDPKDDVVFLYGSNTCYRREDAIAAGLYDERARTNGEDVHISENIHAKLKKRLKFYPLAVCHHMRRDTVRSILRTAWKWRHFANWEAPSLIGTVKANFVNLKWFWLLFLRKDLRMRTRWSNFVLDLMYPFLTFYWDWAFIFRHYLKTMGTRSCKLQPVVQKSRS